MRLLGPVCRGLSARESKDATAACHLGGAHCNRKRGCAPGRRGIVFAFQMETPPCSARAALSSRSLPTSSRSQFPRFTDRLRLSRELTRQKSGSGGKTL